MHVIVQQWLLNLFVLVCRYLLVAVSVGSLYGIITSLASCFAISRPSPSTKLFFHLIVFDAVSCMDRTNGDGGHSLVYYHFSEEEEKKKKDRRKQLTITCIFCLAVDGRNSGFGHGYCRIDCIPWFEGKLSRWMVQGLQCLWKILQAHW